MGKPIIHDTYTTTTMNVSCSTPTKSAKGAHTRKAGGIGAEIIALLKRGGNDGVAVNDIAKSINRTRSYVRATLAYHRRKHPQITKLNPEYYVWVEVAQKNPTEVTPVEEKPAEVAAVVENPTEEVKPTRRRKVFHTEEEENQLATEMAWERMFGDPSLSEIQLFNQAQRSVFADNPSKIRATHSWAQIPAMREKFHARLTSLREDVMTPKDEIKFDFAPLERPDIAGIIDSLTLGEIVDLVKAKITKEFTTPIVNMLMNRIGEVQPTNTERTTIDKIIAKAVQEKKPAKLTIAMILDSDSQLQRVQEKCNLQGLPVQLYRLMQDQPRQTFRQGTHALLACEQVGHWRIGQAKNKDIPVKLLPGLRNADLICDKVKEIVDKARTAGVLI